VTDIETTAEELEPPEMAHGVAVVPAANRLAVTPSVKAEELVERLDVIKQAMQSAMQEGIDYGRIPGVSKPTLLKPGSEKLGVLFQLDIQLVNEETWGPGDHLRVSSKATVYHSPTGARLGFGQGLCSTRERKYAYRQQSRSCPSCGAAAIIKGKAEYGGGWVCFKKKDGCGAKFPDGDKTIEGQPLGEIENPDLPDQWNTVLKMAEKRARIDAVLAVTGASALFTQDVEDAPTPEGPTGPSPHAGMPASEQRPSSRPASEKQREFVRSLFKKHKLTAGQIRPLLAAAGVPVAGTDDVVEAVEALTGPQASAVIERLKDHPVQTGESDIPAPGDGDFRHEPAGQDDLFGGAS
jgi:hypothetical protein